MRRVHAAKSTIEIAHLRDVLESEGIACIVRNNQLASVMGEIQFVECWPELWVAQPGQELRAWPDRAGAAAAARRATAWTCAGCGEHMDAQFSECWRWRR